MSKSVRLKDIAEKIGVSTVTVSKALSGQKGMSEELREKIHTLANDMCLLYLTRMTLPIRVILSEFLFPSFI